MSDTIFAQASGRINVIGEHTDYTGGFVLPAAIDKKLRVKMWRNETPSTVNICDLRKGNTLTFDLRNYGPQKGGWLNYVMGVVYEMQQFGAEIQGFNAEFEGDVPIGAGMSSSAALECGFAMAINELFASGFDRLQLIHAAQQAEHRFAGIRCGIMDPFASIMGKKDSVILLDCRSLEFQYFPFKTGDYRLLLLNTNVAHSLAASEYNHRRAECEEGVERLQKILPEITGLRDLRLEELESCKSALPDDIYRRCRHVVSENLRVLQTVEALQAADLQRVGRLLYQSHASLRHDFAVSCPELDFLVDQALNDHSVLGGRMMGGGFGGCTINLVESTSLEAFINRIGDSYRRRFGIDLTPYTVSVEDGARSSALTAVNEYFQKRPS